MADGIINISTAVEPTATPDSGTAEIYVDSTTKTLRTKADDGVVTDYTGSFAASDISGQTLVVAAATDGIVITDASDGGALKRVTTQTIVDLASPATPTWTAWSTVTIDGGGSLTYTTANGRYYIWGKMLFAQFDFAQTAAGSGNIKVSIDPPGGVTLLDSATCGTVSWTDMGNNNVFSSMGVEADASSNTFWIRRDNNSAYVRGGTMIGNNGNGFGFYVIAAIA